VIAKHPSGQHRHNASALVGIPGDISESEPVVLIVKSLLMILFFAEQTTSALSLFDPVFRLRKLVVKLMNHLAFVQRQTRFTLGGPEQVAVISHVELAMKPNSPPFPFAGSQ
jgi:hypothetical protein